MESKQFIFFVAFLCAVTSVNGQLSCDSTFRYLRPDLFGHCTTCRHSEWTDWNQVANSIGSDRSGRCESGEAYTETRRQFSLHRTHTCQDKVETRSVCVPTQSERLSLLLGLGRRPTTGPQGPLTIITGNKVIPIIPNGRPGPPGILKPQQTLSPPTVNPFNPRFPIRHKKDTFKRQAGRCNEGSICKNLSGKRKRATANEDDSSQENLLDSSNNAKSIQEHNNPVLFSIAEHGHRFKRQANKCAASDKQYLLFMLDTSGSIGRMNFERVKEAIANLTLLFCKDIEVAVLTFNSAFHLEFCFNCYDRNDQWGPYNAIKKIRYRSGQTHTAGATKCACDSLIGPSCGIDTPDVDTCVDVVFITDGHSNDPNRDVCNEVSCLHDHKLKLNTYSMGIAGADKNELNCIQNNSNNLRKFWYDSFEEFHKAIKDLYDNPTPELCQTL